jgi:glycine betaine/choline ABC-type transport system substrate-binding protein
MYNYASLQMEWCLECHRKPEKHLRPRDQVFNMRYEQPSSAKPLTMDGKEYTDQIALGTDLAKKYKLRTVADITSCSTCHR